METLESLGNRITTTEDLQSIVRTMKSLSAVSIRQYERAADSLRHYARNVELGLEVVLRQQLFSTREEESRGPVIAIVFGSDHGLCGRFNEQIADFARDQMRSRDRPGYGAGSEEGVFWLALGVRAAARIEATGQEIEETFVLPGAVGGWTRMTQNVLLKLDEWRTRHDAIRVMVFYNARTDEATAVPRSLQLLPLDPHWLRELRERTWEGSTLPTFTIDTEHLFSFLTQQHLFVTLYRAGVESMASEHATRLAAMQAAERNIKDHLEEMNIAFRQRRQQSITEELLDVVAGFESLRGT